MRLRCTVNGAEQVVDGCWPGESLLHVLRERMGLPGSKNACEQGECGSCTVWLDGRPVCACLVAAGQAPWPAHRSEPVRRPRPASRWRAAGKRRPPTRPRSSTRLLRAT